MGGHCTQPPAGRRRGPSATARTLAHGILGDARSAAIRTGNPLFVTSTRTIAASCIGMLVLIGGCRAPGAPLQRLVEARGLAADLIVQLTTASDAANRAVMADTDDASVAFAR